MPVTMRETEIPGILIIETGIFRDDRGFFTEAYSQKMWEEQGFHDTFVQDSMSLSAKGTLRGMHYQLEPHGMGKLVRALTGSVFDVAVDRPHYLMRTARGKILRWRSRAYLPGIIYLRSRSG